MKSKQGYRIVVLEKNLSVESEGMVLVVDAECGKGNTGSEDGVPSVSECTDIVAVSDSKDGQKDRVSFAWAQ